jgi:uncharacterized protein
VPEQRALPFQQFVIKLHSRCNLACRYCYMYEMADQSWRGRPAVMAPATVAQVACRIGEHARTHALSTVDVVLHGGEPLLAGPAAIDDLATALRAAAGDAEVRLSIQTNGVLLDAAALAVLGRHRIRIGVSLDGGADANDRHRRYANGKGSYEAVAARLGELRAGRYAELFAGLLCTVDLGNEPVRTYEELLRFRPPTIDFLLPHGNWSEPPPGRRTGDPATPYGDWLVAAFDRWYGASRRETGVRMFEEIINLLLGGHSAVESVGLSPVRLLGIDTDGSLEQVDALRSAYDGAAATGYDVFAHDFDQVLTHPAVIARQGGLDALCRTCQQCPLGTVCGGGYYPHRYRAGTGFDNPSVYCADLQRVITHIAGRLNADLSRRRATRDAC